MGKTGRFDVPDRHCRRTDHFLVVTAATFTRGLSALTGLPDNFTVQAFVILLSGGIFA